MKVTEIKYLKGKAGNPFELEKTFPLDTTLKELDEYFKVRNIKEITRIIFWLDKVIVSYKK